MGEEASDAGGPVDRADSRGIEEEVKLLAARHSLAVTQQFWELVEFLDGLSIRDQEAHFSPPAEMAQRRREGYKAAKTMQRAARNMLDSLGVLYKAHGDLHGALRGMNPALVEEIFETDTGDPGNLFLPREIQILETLFRGEYDDLAEEMIDEFQGSDRESENTEVPFKRCPVGFWEEVDDRLSAVASLPVRPALSRGPMPNVVLRSALRSLRDYWLAHSNHPWSRSSLRHKEVRAENDIETLAGPCERFVVDALAVTGIKFSLSELVSAWTTTDADRVAVEGI